MTDVSSNDSGARYFVAKQPGDDDYEGESWAREVTAEVAAMRAQLTKTQEQNWILIARCDELAREFSHRICPSCSAQSLGNRGESCPVDGCDGIIIRTTAEGAQAIAATWERAKRAEAERDERFASVVHDCCVNLVEVRAERDDVIRELADALRELTDHLELGTSPLPETARFSRAALARVDALTGGAS